MVSGAKILRTVMLVGLIVGKATYGLEYDVQRDMYPGWGVEFNLDVYDVRGHRYNVYLAEGEHLSSNTYSLNLGAVKDEDLAIGIIPDVYMHLFARNDLAFIINVKDNGPDGEADTPDDEIVATGCLLAGDGDKDKPFDNVVLISDGFDPLQDRTYRDMVIDPEFNTALNTDAKSPLGRGYDILFLDYKYGGGDIRYNAKVYLEILIDVCLRARANDGEVVVAGFSMGGLITRLALLYAEKYYQPWPEHDVVSQYVKKWISVDSPQQGASAVMINLQRFVRDHKDILTEPWSMLDCDGARQMLYEHITSAKDESGRRTAEHSKFFYYLKDMGDYNSTIPRYALADNNLEGPFPPLNEGQWLMRIRLGLATGPEKEYVIRASEHELASGTYRPTLEEFLKYETAGQLAEWLVGLVSGGRVVVSADIESVPYHNHAYKTTHMPLYSVFDVDKATWNQELAKVDVEDPRAVEAFMRQMEGLSPFQKIYMMGARNKHITFNDELNEKLLHILEKPGVSALTNISVRRSVRMY